MNAGERPRAEPNTPRPQLESMHRGLVSGGGYSPDMAIRPPENWRVGIAEEARELAAGTLDPECAGMAQLYPESLLRATDEALQAFERDLSTPAEPPDDQVFDTIKHVVLRLNAIDDDSHHGGAGYYTDEREQLCEYIDQTLTEHGIDVAALAARRGIGRAEITDEWRDW
jgi:hypothetical protein